jgi:Fe-S-cluster containining protein
MIRQLKRAYASRYGVPVVNAVSTEVFTLTYFARCMDCTFCHDSCCQYGAMIDVENLRRLEPYTEELEQFTGVPRADWLLPGYHRDDAEIPGGAAKRTNVRDGRCVFLNRRGRGCLIHSFCLARGLNVRELKPLFCWLFPFSFDSGTLYPSEEFEDNDLVCAHQGETLYQSARGDLAYLFGPELIQELDELAAEYHPPAPPDRTTRPLKLVS